MVSSYPCLMPSQLAFRRTIIHYQTPYNLPLFAMILLLLLLVPTALAFVLPYNRCRIPTTKIKSNPPLFSSITNDNWKSCAQPRFDEFANCIVGPWSNVKDLKQQDEVEEVMRSCGGKKVSVIYCICISSSYYISILI